MSWESFLAGKCAKLSSLQASDRSLRSCYSWAPVVCFCIVILVGPWRKSTGCVSKILPSILSKWIIIFHLINNYSFGPAGQLVAIPCTETQPKCGDWSPTKRFSRLATQRDSNHYLPRSPTIVKESINEWLADQLHQTDNFNIKAMQGPVKLNRTRTSRAANSTGSAEGEQTKVTELSFSELVREYT